MTTEGTGAAVTSLVPGSAEYDAAMIAKFDKNSAATQGTDSVAAPEVPNRPDHIPEKFWDAAKGEVRLEALAKSYAELEKSRGKTVVEPTKVDASTANPADPDQAQKAVEAAGVDFGALTEEYASDGELSESTYKALESKGFNKDVVDSYIAGQHALAAQWENQGYDVAGGKEQYIKMTEWAVNALSQSEKVAFNSATTGDVDQMKLAVAGLKQRYESENGKAPGLLGGSTTTGSNNGYQSRAQMTADMKDARYKTDPAFRQSVQARLSSTTSF